MKGPAHWRSLLPTSGPCFHSSLVIRNSPLYCGGIFTTTSDIGAPFVTTGTPVCEA